MRRALGLAALLAGCDGVFTHPGAGPTDAPDERDASLDASVDARPPALHHYVISAEQLPNVSKSAQELGLDLDGDSVIDNKFGSAMTLIAQLGFDPSDAAMTAVREGSVILLGELAADSFTDGPATFTLYTGTNPNPVPCMEIGPLVCGLHLHGDATFDVDLASAHYTPVHGTFVDGELVTDMAAPSSTDGKLRLKLNFFQNPVTLELVAARVKVSMPSDDGIASGVIAGALTPEIVSGIIPELANALNAAVATDCTLGKPWPDCGCSSGAGSSTGGKLIAQFDANHDCMITGLDSSALSQQFAPDLANNTLVSFGIGFAAVKATYTP